jgi:hypothetical protein
MQLQNILLKATEDPQVIVGTGAAIAVTSWFLLRKVMTTSCDSKVTVGSRRSLQRCDRPERQSDRYHGFEYWNRIGNGERTR